MPTNIGIMGLGTIGLGVYNILKDKLKTLNEKHDLEINIRAVADLNVDSLNLKDTNTYKDASEMLEKERLDIVVELIGGTGIAKELMIKAIKNKSNIVTANKAIISEFGNEIFSLAKDNNINISYEASVGGVNPIISTMQNYLSSNNITSIKGILNGTCNFILTKMQQGLSYEKALKTAQEEGFAEADPTLDVNGADTAHKITILSRLAFGIDVTFNDIHFEGIQKLKNMDFDFAKENNYKIKLLGIANKKDDSYDIRVHPVLIEENHPLAKVDDEFNAVFIEGDYSGPIMLAGKGAGRYPTATAVVHDVVQIARKIKHGIKDSCPILKKSNLLQIERTKNQGYIRILSVDKPGVLAQEAKVLGDNKINIMGFFQSLKYKHNSHIPDIITVSDTEFINIRAALGQLKNLECVAEDPFFLRIE